MELKEEIKRKDEKSTTSRGGQSRLTFKNSCTFAIALTREDVIASERSSRASRNHMTSKRAASPGSRAIIPW